MEDNLENNFRNVYTKFKLHFYRQILVRFQDREASLTTIETFCMEAISALGNPTINEFACFMNISQPNAAYKLSSLIKKGYVKKTRSPQDKREYNICATEKYYNYYNISSEYLKKVVSRIQQHFTSDQCKQFEDMLSVINDQLMPEVNFE